MTYILLGLIQGLTEFLPVSSSGHLVIIQRLLGMRGMEIEFAIVVHLGTCLAVMFFFGKELLRLFRDRRMLALVALVTVITGGIGIAGKSFFESLFVSILPVALALFTTGIILIISKQYFDASRTKLTVKDAGVLGLVQGLAIIPGISRSGITITALLARGIRREESFTFSFLVSVPAILGAAILEASEMSCWCIVEDNLAPFALAFTASFISGLGALWLLRMMMRRAWFHYFGYYCITVAILTILFVR